MAKDTVFRIGAEKCDSCSAHEEAEPCHCSEESEKSTAKRGAANLIDFKQRASELRVKGTLTGSVSSFEATRGLAFGIMYLNGEGVARDPAKAAPHLAVAAKGGISQARYELARLHIEGHSVPYDPDYAFKLLHSASDDRHAPSMIYLAELYLFGTNCPKDIEEATELLYSAAGQNEPAAMYYLAFIYDKEPDYSNSFEAAYWYRRAAEYGHFKSQIRLAALYATGRGVPQCLDTAEAFLEVAQETIAEQDPRFLLWQGERFAADPETEFLAHALIKAAADRDHTPAQRSLLAHGWRS
jgi:TPR repeat protein